MGSYDTAAADGRAMSMSFKPWLWQFGLTYDIVGWQEPRVSGSESDSESEPTTDSEEKDRLTRTHRDSDSK